MSFHVALTMNPCLYRAGYIGKLSAHGERMLLSQKRYESETATCITEFGTVLDYMGMSAYQPGRRSRHRLELRTMS